MKTQVVTQPSLISNNIIDIIKKKKEKKIHHGQMIQQARKSNKKTKSKETISPIEKYHSKITRYLNHLQSNQEVTISQSKWHYKNPIDSRILTYTSTLKIIPSSSIVHSLQPQQTQHTNLLHST